MKKIVIILCIIGFLVYFQSLMNLFVWDDVHGQVLDNNILYGFNNIPKILFYHWTSYYKPLFYVVLNFFLTVFGDKPFPLHFFQLCLHIINSILVFLLFSKFFKKNISFVLSLIFLVHPAISEAVLYISAIQDVLYLFFGLVALNMILYYRELKYKTPLIFLFLVLSILSKETGIAFLLLMLFYKVLFDKENLKRYFTFSVIFIVFYLTLRIGFLHINPFSPEFKSPWTYDADLHTRLITMPKIVFKYLILSIWPEKLQIFQLWWVRTINFSDFYVPLISVLTFFTAVFTYGVIKYRKIKKETYPYFFFLAWLNTGLLLHIQIIPLDMTFAERWLYIPLIGLLGIAGFILNRVDFSERKMKVFYLILAGIILLFSLRTFIRTFDWYSQKSLALHDFEVDKNNPGTYYTLEDVYVHNNQFSKISELNTQLEQLTPNNENLYNAMAYIETYRGDYKKAEEILARSGKKTLKTRINYGFILINQDPKKAELFLRDSLRYFPNSFEINLLFGVTEYKLGYKQKALEYISKAVKLNPSKITEYEYIRTLIEKSAPINLGL